MTVECIVAYDVGTADLEGERRLRRIARTCEGLGVRVQNSVFEFRCSESQLIRLLHTISEIITPTDSVRVYRLPQGVLDRVATLGRPDPPRSKGSVVW